MRNRRLFELPLEQRTIQLLGVHFDVQGRFFGDYSEVNVVTLQPTLSYRVNDYLSLGFGPTFNRVEGRLETAALVDNGRIVIEEGGEVAGDVAAMGAQKPTILSTPKPVEAAAR